MTSVEVRQNTDDIFSSFRRIIQKKAGWHLSFRRQEAIGRCDARVEASENQFRGVPDRTLLLPSLSSRSVRSLHQGLVKRPGVLCLQPLVFLAEPLGIG